MQKPIVCICCNPPALRDQLNNRLHKQYRLLFSQTTKNLFDLLKENEIACLVAYPFKDGACNLWEFREIRDKFETVPLILACPDGMFEFAKACAETLVDEFVSLDEIERIPELVRYVIDQYDFQKLLPVDWETLRSPPRVKKALKTIHSRFTKIKFAEEVSLPLGISVTTFRKEFKRTCGTSFTQYLIRLKLYYAVYLGQNEGLLGKDIAHRCGFQDEHEFYRSFKGKTGLPFSEFRAKHTFQDFDLHYHENH